MESNWAYSEPTMTPEKGEPYGEGEIWKWKEYIYIRANNPTLNNNIGKFNLPQIWDRVLLYTQGLNLKREVNKNSTWSN